MATREEEILNDNKYYAYAHKGEALLNECIKPAMREYSREMSIGFADWTTDNYWIREPLPRKTTGKIMWALYEDGKEDVLKTTDQLYNLYLESLNQ